MRERYFDRQTMGNVPELQTHGPLRESGPTRWDGKCPAVDPSWLSKAIEERKAEERKAEQRRKGEPETGAGWSTAFDGTTINLNHRGITTPSNPLWIMAVDTNLISDHSGIADPFMICLFPRSTPKTGHRSTPQNRP